MVTLPSRLVRAMPAESGVYLATNATIPCVKFTVVENDGMHMSEIGLEMSKWKPSKYDDMA